MQQSKGDRRQKDREWKLKNREKCREYERVYRESNREKILARERDRDRWRRASNHDFFMRKGIKARLSQATGIPVYGLPPELVEAKFAQLRLRRAVRDNEK